LPVALVLGTVAVLGVMADRMAPSGEAHEAPVAEAHEAMPPEAAPPEPKAEPAPPPQPAREIAGAAHILVAYKGALGAPASIQRSKEEAKRRAEEVRTKVLEDKSRFGALVTEYSDDAPTKPTGGMMGNFERNVMPPAFSDATFALAVGEISPVVETPRGFHVIRRTR